MNDKQERIWIKKYNLAKAYYEYHGNLEIPARFKTINGYEYDENGIALGKWIVTQREAYHGRRKISEEKIKLLEKIEMRFETNYQDKEWDKKYELAKLYYEYNGNLEIPARFKTVNGYEYDENGIALGYWLDKIRQAYQGKRKITEEHLKQLQKIGMRFETKDNEEEWMKKYEFAKLYYKYHKNLEVPSEFKTINGYEYNKKGIALGNWLNEQRQVYKGRRKGNLTVEKIKLLEEIRMRWFLKKSTDYKYQEEEIKKSNNRRKQIEILNRVRSYLNTYNDKSLLSKEKINNEMLKMLNGLRPYLDTTNLPVVERLNLKKSQISKKWMKKYNLAKVYYEHYGNLEIPQKFKTINGIDYDENGIALGNWISRQRIAYKGKETNKLTDDRKSLLDEIGMVVDIYEKIWNEYYDLAKAYYKHYGNLKVPQKFVTENGFPLGKWIKSQRLAFNGKGTYKLTENQIELLDEIEMIWFTSEKIDNKYQTEEITDSNKKRKQIEILNRVRSYLNTHDEETLPTKEEINKGMVKILNKKTNGGK